MRALIIIFIAATLTSCEANLLNGDNSGGAKSISDENIIGNWSHNSTSDTLNILTKIRQLPEDEYGITLFANGTLKEWKNVGFCGTPPITYGEFEGTWELRSDSVLTIHGTYWGGDVTMEWKIITIHDEQLKYFIQKWDTVMNE